jgi:hypothetical protein
VVDLILLQRDALLRLWRQTQRERDLYHAELVVLRVQVKRLRIQAARNKITHIPQEFL